MWVGLVMALCLAGALIAALSTMFSAPPSSTVDLVLVSEVEEAAKSLGPGSDPATLNAAKACTAPLGQIRLRRLPGTSGGTVRVRVGAYLSPPVTIGDQPVRVAFPLPGYPGDVGPLSIEGVGSGLEIALTPPRVIPQLDGTDVHNVRFRPRTECR